MPTIGQARGMLLEEAVLYLLERCGYQTVTEVRADPTLEQGPAGLRVKGRGTSHQIDAVADFLVAQPFAYPSRLLVEAKCYSPGHKVGLDDVRSAVGRLKDIREWWGRMNPFVPQKGRYAYQFAYVSVTGFTSEAYKYAFAQDIYTITFTESTYFKDIVDAIRQVNTKVFGVGPRADISVDLGKLRRTFRRAIAGRTPSPWPDMPTEAEEALTKLVETVRRTEGAILGMLNCVVPVFLVPAPSIQLRRFAGQVTSVRIVSGDEGKVGRGWYLADAEDGERLFSFDLPRTMVEQYAESGVLTRREAKNLKAETMEEIQGFVSIGGEIRLARFHLDEAWLDRLQA